MAALPLVAPRLAVAAALLAAASCGKAPRLEEPPPPATAAADPALTLESAAVVGGHVVVTFTITDGGARVSLETAKALSPRWTLARLDVEPVTGFPAWRSMLLLGSQTVASLPPAGPGTPAAQVMTNQKQPGAEAIGGTGGTLDEPIAGSGRFTYTFADVLPAEFIPPAGASVGARFRVGAYLYGVAAGTERTATTLDFAPNGSALAEYGVVREENCRVCHGLLRMHGGRMSGVDLCVTCHTWQFADPDTMDPAAMARDETRATYPNPLELGRLVHRIHRGAKLPTLFLASSSATWPPVPFTAAPPLPYPAGQKGLAPVGTKYSVIGKSSAEYVFGRVASRVENYQPAKTLAEGVLYPQDLRNCDACHYGAPNADVIGRTAAATVRVSRRTCSGCHTDVFYGDPNKPAIVTPDATHLAHTGGRQDDDSLCADCHVRDCPSPPGCAPRKLYAPISDIHRPLNDKVASGSPHWSRVTATVVGVQNAKADSAPTVTFRVSDRNGGLNPLNVAAYEPFNATSSPVPRGMSGFSIILSGPTDDYLTGNSVLRESPPLGSVPDGTGLFTYAFNAKLPATASGTWAIGLEGRRRGQPAAYNVATDTFNWPYTGESISEYPSNIVKYVDVASGTLTSDPARARRTVVDQAKCEACHLELNLHGANRHDVAHCLLCHTPDATDWDKRPRDTRTVADGGVVGTAMVLLNDPLNALATTKRWGYATVDGLEERTIHMKVMTHRIHVGEREGAASLEGIRPFAIYANSTATAAPNYIYFDDVRFPGDLANCEVCHRPGSWRIEAIPAGAQPTKANERASVAHTGTSSVPATAAHASTEPKTLPITATCLSCHTNGAAVDHAAGKTSGGVEQCGSCHGETGADSVRKWHAVP